MERMQMTEFQFHATLITAGGSWIKPSSHEGMRQVAQLEERGILRKMLHPELGMDVYVGTYKTVILRNISLN